MKVTQYGMVLWDLTLKARRKKSPNVPCKSSNVQGTFDDFLRRAFNIKSHNAPAVPADDADDMVFRLFFLAGCVVAVVDESKDPAEEGSGSAY